MLRIGIPARQADGVKRSRKNFHSQCGIGAAENLVEAGKSLRVPEIFCVVLIHGHESGRDSSYREDWNEMMSVRERNREEPNLLLVLDQVGYQAPPGDLAFRRRRADGSVQRRLSCRRRQWGQQRRRGGRNGQKSILRRAARRHT